MRGCRATGTTVQRLLLLLILLFGCYRRRRFLSRLHETKILRNVFTHARVRFP